MRTLVDQLSNYADYHRDRRNIATHFVGIPTIVVSIEALLARVQLEALPSWANGALAVSLVVTAAFYLRLDVRFGALMALLLAGAYAIGTAIAAQSFAVWLAASLGLFVGGWAVQFVGHFFEGKKPAFVDDLVGLLVGPLFVAAEVVFFLGLRKPLADEIVRRSGPTRIGRANVERAAMGLVKT